MRIQRLHFTIVGSYETTTVGKTLQTISFLGYLKHFKSHPGPHLVVVPKTTIQNWAREFARWVPDFNVVVLSGTKEERAEIIREQLLDSNFEVCITSYEVCLIEKAVFRKFSFSYIIIDEAHRIKNVNSILSRIVREFVSRNRMLITGTPLQNNLQELFSLLNFICPEIFSDYKDLESFLHKDAKTASGTTTAAPSGAPSVTGDDVKDGDVNMDEEASVEDIPTKTAKELEEEKNRKVVEALHKILRPFLLRRVKADVERNLLPSMFTGKFEVTNANFDLQQRKKLTSTWVCRRCRGSGTALSWRRISTRSMA